eukprot:6200029-Pleurochrysis_carterae.AAC.3
MVGLVGALVELCGMRSTTCERYERRDWPVASGEREQLRSSNKQAASPDRLRVRCTPAPNPLCSSQCMAYCNASWLIICAATIHSRTPPSKR